MAPEAEQLRLLVVDDEPKLTEFLRMELEVEGYAVDVVHDGASGLIALRGEPAPDLVLLDWNLPDFTGLDICRRIRATGMTVPVLMLTGYDEVKDKKNVCPNCEVEYRPKITWGQVGHKFLDRTAKNAEMSQAKQEELIKHFLSRDPDIPAPSLVTLGIFLPLYFATAVFVLGLDGDAAVAKAPA